MALMAKRNSELTTVKSEHDANDKSRTRDEPKMAPVYLGSDHKSKSLTLNKTKNKEKKIN